MKSLARHLGLVLLMAAAPVAAHADIVNPGFETGSLSPWFQDRTFNTITAPWTVTDATSHLGTFSATDIGNAELKQTFAPIAVSSITDLSFWAKHSNTEGPSLAIDLFYSNGSDNEFAVSTTGTDWNFFDITADLTSGLSLDGISFFGNSIANDSTFLDDVNLATRAAPTGVPEPLTLSLFGAGLAGAVVLRKRKKA